MTDIKNSEHWAVMLNGHATEYDDEQDAREHLGYYPPEAYVVKALVTRFPWKRAD